MISHAFSHCSLSLGGQRRPAGFPAAAAAHRTLSRPRARLFRIGTGRVGQRTAVAQRRSPLHGTGLPVSSFSCGFSPFGAERFSGRVQLPLYARIRCAARLFAGAGGAAYPNFIGKNRPVRRPVVPAGEAFCRSRSLLPTGITHSPAPAAASAGASCWWSR